MRRSPWIVATVAILAAAASGCRNDASNLQRSLAAAPEGEAKAPRVTCLGRIVPGEKVLSLVPAVSAPLAELRVSRGQKVKAGDVLAVMKTHAPAQEAVRRAAAAVLEAESQLKRVKAGEKPETIEAQARLVESRAIELDFAERELRRHEPLYHDGVVAEHTYRDAARQRDNARALLQNAEQALAAARHVRAVDVEVAASQLATARAEQQRAAAELELSLLRAPIDGEVLEIYTWPGEAAGPRGVLALGDSSRVMAEADVYVSDVRNVRLGAEVTVTGESFDGEFPGRVEEILKLTDSSAVFDPDPLSFADKRIVKVRIRLAKAPPVAGLFNTQVRVAIGR